MLLAAIASQLPALVATVAAGMAIGGFALQAKPAIKGASDRELRRAAAFGGLAGLGVGGVVAVLSVTLSI